MSHLGSSPRGETLEASHRPFADLSPQEQIEKLQNYILRTVPDLTKEVRDLKVKIQNLEYHEHNKDGDVLIGIDDVSHPDPYDDSLYGDKIDEELR